MSYSFPSRILLRLASFTYQYAFVIYPYLLMFDTSFLFCGIPSHCWDVPYCLPIPINGDLGCFWFLTIMNKAAISIRMKVFFRLFSLALIVYSLKMKCHVIFWCLFCWMFELPGSVIQWLTWIWGKFSVVIVSDMSSATFFLLLLVFLYVGVAPFVAVPQTLDVTFCPV